MANHFFSRIVDKVKPKASGSASDVGAEEPFKLSSGLTKPRTRQSLEQAYRELLVEHQVLAETNTRLHTRLSEQADGLEESPAARRLIEAQRKALAERSRVQRELGYDNKRLQLEHTKLNAEIQDLRSRLSHQVGETQRLREQLAAHRTELAELKALLRSKNHELALLAESLEQEVQKSSSSVHPAA